MSGDRDLTNRFETISQVGRTLTATLNLDSVLGMVTRAAVEVTGAEESTLLLVDSDSGELYLRAEYNFANPQPRTLRLRASDSLAGQVLATQKPLLLDQSKPEKIRTHYLVRSLIYVPLVVKGQAIGVLGVDNRQEKAEDLNESHIDVLSVLADYAAIAIENARLYKQAEIDRQKFESMVHSVADGVLVINEAAEVVLLNEPARQLLNLSDQPLEHRPLEELVAFPDLVEIVLDREQTSTQKLDLENQNGRHIHAIIQILPGVGKTITLQDITPYKELEKVKNEFVQAISHDLRSPLTAIMGYLDLITRVGKVNEEQMEFIRRIQSGVKSISALISDLIELGQVEAEFDLVKEVVPLGIVAKYCVDNLRHLFDHKKQTVNLDIPSHLPPVYGVPVRLRQMITNLIDNASKYTPEGGRITLRARQEGDQIIFQVEDNGIGIPATELPYIFDKLYRASNIPLDTPGTGVGLSIVRSIVQKHGGRLWCDSRPGQGTVFTVVLPAVHPQP